MRHPPHLSHLFTPLLGAVLATAGGSAAHQAAASGSAFVRTLCGGARKTALPADARPYRTSANGAGHTAGLLASGVESDSAPGASRDHGTLRTTDPTGTTAPADPSARALGRRAPAALGTELAGAAPQRAPAGGNAETALIPLTEEYRLGLTTMDPQHADENDDSAVKNPYRRGEEHGTTSPVRILPDPGHSHRRRLLRCAHRPHLSGHRSRGRGHPASPAAAWHVRT